MRKGGLEFGALPEQQMMLQRMPVEERQDMLARMKLMSQDILFSWGEMLGDVKGWRMEKASREELRDLLSYLIEEYAKGPRGSLSVFFPAAGGGGPQKDGQLSSYTLKRTVAFLVHLANDGYDAEAINYYVARDYPGEFKRLLRIPSVTY